MLEKVNDCISQEPLEEPKHLLKKGEVFIDRNSILGKKILEISRITRQRKETQPANTLIDMADFICEVRSYFGLPKKKLKPFSKKVGASLFEQNIDVEIMAVTAAIYHDIFESNVYMIGGKYYLAECFRSKERGYVWDEMLLALSFDLDIRDETIHSLMRNSDMEARLTCVSEIKREMQEDGSLEADFVMRLAQRFFESNCKGVWINIDHGKHKYEEVDTHFQKNNRKAHKICPWLKWFTDLMEKESIVVRYETRGVWRWRSESDDTSTMVDIYDEVIKPAERFGNWSTYVIINAYDTKQNYAKVGMGVVKQDSKYLDGYFTTMAEHSPYWCYPLEKNACPMYENFKDVIVEMVRGKQNKKNQGSTIKGGIEHIELKFQEVDFSGFAVKESMSFKEWNMVVENLKHLITTEEISTCLRIEEYKNSEDFVVRYRAETNPGIFHQMRKHYCPMKYGTKKTAVIN